MSGLGPAACWLAHKRIDSWSKMAKERVSAVRRGNNDKNDDKSPNSKSSSIDSTSSITSTVSSTTTTTNSQTTTTAASSDTATPSTSKTSSFNDSQNDSNSSEDCNVTKEQCKIQPASNFANTDVIRHSGIDIGSPLLHSQLQHQSKSFPPRLQRTPSVNSQSSLDSAQSRNSSHRGSSPQIRAFAPDGRSTLPSEHGSLQYSRSPSPMRAISLDARSCPAIEPDMRTPSPSQNSLTSMFSGSSVHNNMSCLSPKLIAGRSLSPLLIPPRTPAGIEAAACGPASPLGALQLDLYTRQEGPMYISAEENTTSLGRLHLRAKYDSHLCDLTVHLIEAHDLCSFDEGGFHDPFVRLTIQPEIDQRKRQTAMYRGETHPYFDQHFKFPISRDQLQGKELILQVLDYDRYSHNDIIGELRIRVDEMDLTKSIEIWGDVVRMKKPLEDRPELLVSLNYLPQAERLTVVIMKAKNLETESEPSVKMYLIINGKRVKKKKTMSAKGSDPKSPIWNEAFTFNLPSTSFPTSGLEIYVLASGSNEANAIGSCGIGLQECDAGRQHWQDMMHNARKPTAMWHYLR